MGFSKGQALVDQKSFQSDTIAGVSSQSIVYIELEHLWVP